nr:MAG TPA: hypothetical protein [Caudoviricetes sp.]
MRPASLRNIMLHEDATVKGVALCIDRCKPLHECLPPRVGGLTGAWAWLRKRENRRVVSLIRFFFLG